jgi:hypothetical protein
VDLLSENRVLFFAMCLHTAKVLCHAQMHGKEAYAWQSAFVMRQHMAKARTHGKGGTRTAKGAGTAKGRITLSPASRPTPSS